MRKVLVVDDSLSVRKVIERTLRNGHMHVVSASSGAEAREIIEKTEPDLIVSDVLMPDIDGYEFCEWVKTHPRFNRTPVLLISGIVNDAARARAAQVRAEELLRKPFSADVFLAAVERLLGRADDESAAPPPAAAATALPGDAESFTTADFKKLLEPLIEMEGVRLAALVDRDGFVIESAGDVAVDVEVAAALTSCLVEASGGIGRELDHGPLQGLLLEYDRGVISLHAIGDVAMLALLISDPPVLGKVRYHVRKLLPELTGAM
jgi:CheY-like chemotaxis protein/predicted regulator of Ras-like GTPase activity (Roadblock/LC7/MglB family)